MIGGLALVEKLRHDRRSDRLDERFWAGWKAQWWDRGPDEVELFGYGLNLRLSPYPLPNWRWDPFEFRSVYA